MTTLIQPLFSSELCTVTTRSRFFTMFTPIQQTADKQSDLTAYFFTPLLDSAILEPAFALNAAIQFLNCFATLTTALLAWTISQQESAEVIDQQVSARLEIAFNQLFDGFISLGTQSINSLFSFLSLFTRPIASAVHALSSEEQNEHVYGQGQYAQ